MVQCRVTLFEKITLWIQVPKLNRWIPSAQGQNLFILFALHAFKTFSLISRPLPPSHFSNSPLHYLVRTTSPPPSRRATGPFYFANTSSFGPCENFSLSATKSSNDICSFSPEQLIFNSKKPGERKTLISSIYYTKKSFSSASAEECFFFFGSYSISPQRGLGLFRFSTYFEQLSRLFRISSSSSRNDSKNRQLLFNFPSYFRSQTHVASFFRSELQVLRSSGSM